MFQQGAQNRPVCSIGSREQAWRRKDAAHGPQELWLQHAIRNLDLEVQKVHGEENVADITHEDREI